MQDRRDKDRKHYIDSQTYLYRLFRHEKVFRLDEEFAEFTRVPLSTWNKWILGVMACPIEGWHLLWSWAHTAEQYKRRKVQEVGIPLLRHVMSPPGCEISGQDERGLGAMLDTVEAELMEDLQLIAEADREYKRIAEAGKVTARDLEYFQGLKDRMKDVWTRSINKILLQLRGRHEGKVVEMKEGAR